MVLAAGAGRRLRPHTDELPKALIGVADQVTILDIALGNLAAVELRDVVVVVGYAASAVESRRSALERRHGVRLTLVHNDRAEIWNNAYSMWLARDHLGEGVLMVNGDTVHPVSVEQTLLAARGPDVLLAVDTHKPLAEEEMKVQLGADGTLAKITKLMDPAQADGEYIGVTLLEPAGVVPVVEALQRTFERDPARYYEDGFQALVDSGGRIDIAPIPPGTAWVEVDNHDDLVQARRIAPGIVAES